MIQRVQKQRDLTVLITTHYMDEADKLCDRIAIVDHGQLMALDLRCASRRRSPARTCWRSASRCRRKAGIAPSRRCRTSRASPDSTISSALLSDNGPATTTALMETAARAGVAVLSLSVQSTSLDDVFVHYTGHALRDALQEPSPMDRTFMVRRRLAMHRTWAIIERELRRFRRSPTLIVMSLFFPIVQLVVLGYAFGGVVKHLKVAVVDQDHGISAVKVRELCNAVGQRRADVRDDRLQRPGAGAG